MNSKKNWLKVFSLAVFVCFLASCGGGGESTSSPSSGIGPTVGTVVSSDGNVALNVPAGALNSATVITIQESSVSGSVGTIGKKYDFSPDGTQFNIPVHVKITYDPSSLPAGISEADLTLAYFTSNGWEIIVSSVVNQTNHSIEADITHFSTIGLSIKNPYPQTLVKEMDFDGHIAKSFRVPIGDDGTTDLGSDVSLLSIGNFTNWTYPKVRFNVANAGWYVATAFNKNRWLNNGWDSEPSNNDASYYDDKHDYHPGEDWNIISGGSDDAGKPVHAIANGRVLFNGWKYGHTIILGHKLDSGEVVASFYGHLQRKPSLTVGGLINKGDVIGNIGNTGTTPFHLHFEIAKGIGADGTIYMLKKNSSNAIVFNNESINTISGQKYYGSFWRWPGVGLSAEDEIKNNWYSPSEFIKNHQAGYTIKSLVLPGHNYSVAHDINNSGQVVGYSGTSNSSSDYHPFIFSGGSMIDLGILPNSTWCVALRINDVGQVVGKCAVNGYDRAFLYSNGVMTDLGLIVGGSSSIAQGINNQGQIVGYNVINGVAHGFLYSNGTVTDIGSLPGCDSSTVATAINDIGQVVGSSCNQAFLYSGGTMKSLGYLSGYPYTDVTGINNGGQIVGMSIESIYYNGNASAFLYSNGTITDLGFLTGDWWSGATDINNIGQVVIRGYYRSFLYSDGKMTELSTLIDSNSGLSLVDAFSINDAGQIVGSGRDSNGNPRAILITPN